MFRITTLALQRSCLAAVELRITRNRQLSTEKLIHFKDTYLRLDKIKDLRDQFSNKVKVKMENRSSIPREKLTQKLAKKGTEVNNWYLKTIGLDQVKVMQDRVVTMQVRFN